MAQATAPILDSTEVDLLKTPTDVCFWKRSGRRSAACRLLLLDPEQTPPRPEDPSAVE
jgi:hypothetical protein